MKRITCHECGKPVSRPVDDYFIIRAYIVCPECLEKIDEENKQ